jgi:GMP synthase-like glutamine amidotransferase
VDTFDLLVVMGGPMGVHDHRDYPWLAAEKALIGQAIDSLRAVIGICLGAQMIAEVLGGRVRQNHERAIGWFPVQLLRNYGPFSEWPPEFTVLHWHGDTFTIPPGAVRVAESASCANEAFLFGDRVAALQFHLEIGNEELSEAGEELSCGIGAPGTYIQTPEQIRLEPPGGETRRAALHTLLDRLVAPLSSRG